MYEMDWLGFKQRMNPEADKRYIAGTKRKQGRIIPPYSRTEMRFAVYYFLLVANLSSDLLFPMQCSVTCGEGIEVRQVLCRSGDQCDGEKPESVRECKLVPCNGMYCSSQFNALFSRTK